MKQRVACTFFLSFFAALRGAGASVGGLRSDWVEEHLESPRLKRALSFLEGNVISDRLHTNYYSMPTVSHDKEPGRGYIAGSPYHGEQQAWVEQNGDNSLPLVEDRFRWVPSPFRPTWQAFYEYPITSVIVLFLHVIVLVVFAYFYRQYMASWRQTSGFQEQLLSNQDRGWSHSLIDCNCQKDWNICLLALCCPIIRWADTIGNDKVLKGSFWTAFFLMLFLGILGPFTFGVSVIISICVGIYFRQRMRTIFNHSPGKPIELLGDVILWCCCPFIAIVQEAREVERVMPVHKAEAA